MKGFGASSSRARRREASFPFGYVHMAVFAALKARDPDGAEAAMRTHLVRQRTALRELARNARSKLAEIKA